MKPIKIFSILFSLLILFFLLILAFPRGGVFYGDKVLLRLPELKKLFVFEKDTSLEQIDFMPPGDSLRHFVSQIESGEEIIPEDSLNDIWKIEYPGGNHSYLSPFFSQLAKSDNHKIRIFHYGDSQLEGDRITKYLRRHLQIRFGGEGCGLIMIKPGYAANLNLVQDADLNFYWSDVMNNAHKNGRVLGPLLGSTHIKKAVFDKLSGSKSFAGEAEFRFNPQEGPGSVNRFREIKMYTGPLAAEARFVLSDGNHDLDLRAIGPNNHLNTVTFHLNESLGKYVFRVSSVKSFDILGLSFEGDHGIIVDNIPIRGSAGLEFTKMDAGLFRDFVKQEETSLILLQFGVNVVPHIVDNYDYYKNWLKEQINFLKKNAPDACIILMGVSDMARKMPMGYESYPNIPILRDAQKMAAFETNIAFWDVYSAMGGENSMLRWAEKDPPWATKDYIHLNVRGGRELARLFYKALLNDYKYYVESK